MRLHREAYGKGARLAKVLADENTVVVIMDDLELLPNEEFLISEGHEVTVLETRARFQQAIRAKFSAAVERATGRRVIGFNSTTHLDPNYIVEIFRLGDKADISDDLG